MVDRQNLPWVLRDPLWDDMSWWLGLPPKDPLQEETCQNNHNSRSSAQGSTHSGMGFLDLAGVDKPDHAEKY